MENSRVYQHTRLAPQHIRLIELFPSKALRVPLECRLISVSLPHCPAYEALSYCWGSSIFTDQMKCDACASISITENCAEALYQLRALETSRLL
jgi:hypothetical protein